MKREEGEVNQYVNRCKPFHRKNTIFGADTCRSRRNAKLMRIVPHRKSNHSVYWLILLARYNNNDNTVYMISTKKRNLNELAKLIIYFV